MNTRDARGLRLYRLLLRLFPKRFRESRGREMESLFLEMKGERRDTRTGLIAGFWLHLIWDTASHALRERFSRAPHARRSPPHSADTRNAPPHSSGPRDGGPRNTIPKTSLTIMLTHLWNDLQYAIRTALRQPVYGGIIIFMMALGIAGNAAVFRIFDGLILRPLPFPAAERLVDLDVKAPGWNLDHVGMAYADFVAWREKNRSFEAMGVFDTGGANFSGPDGASRITAAAVSYDFPRVLQLEPVLGRLFTPEEDVPDGARVVLLSHDFWQERFGGSPDVLGQTAKLDDQPYAIVGVLPPEASAAVDADVWSPLQEDPDSHDSFYLVGFGRLKPGVTVDMTVDDLTRVHKGMVDQWSVNEATFPLVEPLRQRYLGSDVRLGAGLLLGAVAIVLLIACANIAGLMLVRSFGRAREMGIRQAIGAPRNRIVRQLLTESLLLAVVGAGLGTWLGVRGSEAMVRRMADQFPSWISFDLDWRFLLFTVSATVGAAVLFGLAPAVQTSAVNPAATLHASSTRTTASGRRRRAMGALVVGEVALAMLLLVVGALAVKDLERLQRVDPGLRTEGVLSFAISLPPLRYADGEARLAYWDEALERLERLPGVESAAATTVLPLAGQHSGWFFQVEDAPPRAEDEVNPVVLNRAVSPGYLKTMGVELVAGRSLSAFDGREDGSMAAVVNETFVREFLSHRSDPLGAKIKTGGEDEPWWTVVGVTRDTRHYGLDREMRPAVYQPLRQMPTASLSLVVKASGDPNRIVASVRDAIRHQDPEVPIYDVATMDERLAASLWTRRASSWLLAAFSAVALILAVSGLYGVISYTVSERVQEIGIRMALGAERGRVLGQVLREGMAIVGVGLAIGLGGAMAAAGMIAGVLSTGLSPTDPTVYVGVSALLLVVATVANLLPARRAALLEPMRVLRSE